MVSEGRTNSADSPRKDRPVLVPHADRISRNFGGGSPGVLAILPPSFVGVRPRVRPERGPEGGVRLPRPARTLCAVPLSWHGYERRVGDEEEGHSAVLRRHYRRR